MQANELDLTLSLASLIEKYQITSLRPFLYYLTQIWRDLSHHSLSKKKKGITRVTFSKYYDLPGIIGERLFSIFNKSNNECLNPKEFIEGMLILFSESMSILIRFIFHFYDFNNDGNISKEDVRIVLSYLPLSRNFEQKINNENRILSILNKTFGSNDLLNLTQFQSITETNESEVFAYLILFLLRHRPFSNETLVLYENKGISKNIKANIYILKYHQTSSSSSLHQSLELTTIKFSSLSFFPTLCSDVAIESHAIKPNQSLTNNTINIIKENWNANNENDNNAIDKNKLVHRSISTFGLRKLNIEEPNKRQTLPYKIISEKKSEAEDDDNCNDIDYDYDNDNDIDYNNDNDNDNIKNDADSKTEQDSRSNQKRYHEGYLYKLTTTNKFIKQMWFKLIEKDIFYYKRKEDGFFRGMHNLSGSYIKENEPFAIEDVKVYSFSIIYPKLNRTYYVLNQEEYIKWIKELKAITHSKKLEEEYETKEMIYKGKFSQVYKGIRKKTNKAVAIKLLDKKTMNSDDLELVKTEIDILKLTQHPNIIKLYDVFENEEYIFIGKFLSLITFSI